MKTCQFIVISSALLLGCVVAQVPQKAPISRYVGLWNNSPFTSKPPPQEAAPAVNPLEDYVLLGVSPIKGGYRVTMMEKKAPDKRITVESDNPKSAYKVLGVTRKPGDPLGTTVRLSMGSISGVVSYDKESLALTPAQPPQNQAPGQPPIPGQPQIPGIQPPPQPPNGQQPLRQPRPRVVPPPPPQLNPAALQQQQQQRQQAIPGQPIQPQNIRPSRR